MKNYTDIEQSKVLSKILPIESADMWYWEFPTAPEYNNYRHPMFHKGEDIHNIPCWSLVALLDLIPQVKLDSIKQYDKKLWRCCAYFASDWHNSDWCDNSVDACYEIILKLHDLNLL